MILVYLHILCMFYDINLFTYPICVFYELVYLHILMENYFVYLPYKALYI